MKKFSRSNFIGLVTNSDLPGVKQPANNAAPVAVTSGIKPYTGVWGKQQVLHLIRRSLFGITPADYNYFSKLTLEQSLDTLLTPAVFADPPVNNYNDNTYSDPDVPFGETWVYCPFSDNNGIADKKRLASLRAWWIGLLINQDRSLTEKMALFLHNQVTCEYVGTKDIRTFYSYLAPIRFHALGNFKKLVLDTSTCPGMLQYLGGNESTAVAPNENYAREMQELFTVGKGPGSHYTEQDVVAAARIMTGWWDGPRRISTAFNPAVHDTNDKHFSAFYNNTVIKGKTGEAGATELTEMMDMIFATREVARHTCRSLYIWFLGNEITTAIEANMIEPMADIFIKHDFELAPVVRALLGSEHFFDAANMGSQIKNPVDHLIGLCRQFKVTSFPSDLAKQYEAWYKISDWLSEQMMCPGEPPNVAGWPAYSVAPVYSRLWINSDTLVVRNSTTDTLLSANNSNDGQIDLKFDVLAFTAALPEPANLQALINDSTTLLSAVPFDVRQTNFLRSILLAGQQDDNLWSHVWHAYHGGPADKTAKDVVVSRLSQYYTYILQQAESHLI